MSTRLLILTAILFQAPFGLEKKVQAAESPIVVEAISMNAKSPISVEFKHSVVGQYLEVRYSIANRSGKPIFVFDRLWSNQAQKVDPNWAYVRISGKTAVFRRMMEIMPRGVHMETPPEPYGREIAAGEAVAGAFKIQIPLTEGGPYDRMQGRKPSGTVSIDKIELEIGWCPKSDLEKGLGSLSPVKYAGETLWPFSYGQLRRVQKTAKSLSSPAQLRARVLSPRPAHSDEP